MMTPTNGTGTAPADSIALDERPSTHDHHPPPVVITEAGGVWVSGVDGTRGSRRSWVTASGRYADAACGWA
jgi:hypothetical protein